METLYRISCDTNTSNVGAVVKLSIHEREVHNEKNDGHHEGLVDRYGVPFSHIIKNLFLLS
jgi:hypothetical protein